ncbi:hypothetical protein NDU88_002525 [Pleurodeles waltl]|uniref:Uncharacterized protein n=1 Tax=Pleurodeles waltl TaxID=8319 RepID=A0AAV7UXK5_PLEWA|nr:hypothetical protein NDU88_002525 [Pleurodeles waltl]
MDDSDDDEFLNQLLNGRPPPYAIDDNRPSTSTGRVSSTKNKVTMNPVQVSPVSTPGPVQNSISMSTAPDIQSQLQTPQVQRLYPAVPILETTTNLMVLLDPTYMRPKLIQTEPTPPLLPQPQQQMVPNYTLVTGLQSAMAPVINQNIGVNAPQVLGNRQTPATISLPITVGPPVSMYAQAKPSAKGETNRVVSATDRFVKLAKCLWEDLNTLFEIIVSADLWLECKRSVDWPAAEPARDRVTGAPSPEVMKYYYKVIEFLKQRVSTQNVDWQKIDWAAQEPKESIHAYYERLLKAFKNYSGTEVVEAKDMNHLLFRFIEGLRPEISQLIKNHLICWQAKPIDEVLQYAKYCSDEIELKQRKLKEKAMVMQIKAAQSGLQGGCLQQMVQQQQGNRMFQAQVELGTVQGLHRFVVCDLSPVSLLGRDLLCKTRCSITCSNEGIEVQTTSDDEGDDGQVSEPETETTDEEYPLINFFPMFTVTDLPADLQGAVKEKVWDLMGKEVGLIKGVEPVKVSVKPNAVFPQVPQYHMVQDVLIKVLQLIADFVKQEVLKEVMSSPCNSPIMGLRKPCGKV